MHPNVPHVPRSENSGHSNACLDAHVSPFSHHPYRANSSHTPASRATWTCEYAHEIPFLQLGKWVQCGERWALGVWERRQEEGR